MWVWWALFGCGARTGAPVVAPIVAVEVYDVPPPPEHRTLQLGGAHPHAPGTLVWIADVDGTRLTRGDVVDNATSPPSITVYVPEVDTDRVLDATGLIVTPQ